MALNIAAMVDGLQSQAMELGLFEKVNLHEPKSAPRDLVAAIWADRVQPIPLASGLNTTSALVVFMFRIYMNAFEADQDVIDPRLLNAADVVLTQYSQNFTLAGAVREIDLLGEFGTPLSAQAGFLTIDRTMFRCMDIFVPVVINDAWTQEG